MKTLFETRLRNEAATTGLGAEIATCVQQGDVIWLCGPLGAGKTTFARGFIQASLRLSEATATETEIPSPTFTLVQTYETTQGTIWHFDLYRIESPNEVYELGIEEALDTGISLIEWPEKASEILPLNRLEIRLSFSGSERHVKIVGDDPWAAKLRDARIDV